MNSAELAEKSILRFFSQSIRVSSWGRGHCERPCGERLGASIHSASALARPFALQVIPFSSPQTPVVPRATGLGLQPTLAAAWSPKRASLTHTGGMNAFTVLLCRAILQLSVPCLAVRLLCGPHVEEVRGSVFNLQCSAVFMGTATREYLHRPHLEPSTSCERFHQVYTIAGWSRHAGLKSCAGTCPWLHR